MNQNQVTLHAALWLDEQTGQNDHTGWTNGMIEEEMRQLYPTGFSGFWQDIVAANAVS